MCALALLIGTCATSAAWAGVPAGWKDSSYAYNAQGAPLNKVLADFARSHGVELRFDGAADPVQGVVKAPTAVEFLDRLASVHRFQWFVYGRVLYVSLAHDTVTERIEVAREAIADAKSALTGVGLFDSRFGWGELTEQGAVTVSGPREYVRLVRALIADRDRSDDYEAMVFRLKHAPVDDRSITIRNQTVVTPGAASLLKGMLGSGGGGTNRAVFGSTGALTALAAQPSMFSSLSGETSSRVAAAPGTNVAGRDNAARATAGGGARGVSVEGDVRTNSIVIYDLAKRRNYYQRLIDAIDVPQHLVEIEACVVDVNREQVGELGFGFTAGGDRGSLTIDQTGILSSPIGSGSQLIVASLDRFFARISMMERDGLARVVAKPSVLTLENLVAVLDLSQTVYVRATGERVASIEPVTAGMLLRVTPRVLKDKSGTQVHLTVDIEDGKVLPATADSGTPEVQRSTISTQAVLMDRQSLIVGGYDTSSSSNTDDAVPGISKVPLIGALFTGTKKASTSRQRLFILTPRLVRTEVAQSAR